MTTTDFESLKKQLHIRVDEECKKCIEGYHASIDTFELDDYKDSELTEQLIEEQLDYIME